LSHITHAPKQHSVRTVIHQAGKSTAHLFLAALQGIWKPAKIANPAYYDDKTPLANLGKINAAAIEIWTMDNNYYFDDIVVANDPAVADAFRVQTWTPKHDAEVCARPEVAGSSGILELSSW